MLAHGVSQGAITVAQGGKFQHGFFSAAFSVGAEVYTGKINSNAGKVAASSVVGGTASVLGGGKFANGAVTGAYVMMFNFMMHQKQTKYRIEFFNDSDEALRAMQDYTKKTGNEIAGVSATHGEESGIVVWYHDDNTPNGSHIEYMEENVTGTRYVRDGLNKYILGDQHYHTHGAWNQMQTVSPQDIATQAIWSKPLNILYNKRIWMLQYNSKRNNYYYERTKIKY